MMMIMIEIPGLDLKEYEVQIQVPVQVLFPKQLLQGCEMTRILICVWNVAKKYHVEENSTKKRHWENSHRGDLTFRYKTMIVPINHEKARALLKKKTQKQTSKSLTTASTPQAVHNFPSGINKELVTIDDHKCQ